MFEEYLEDARFFYDQAEGSSDEAFQRRHYRVSVFCVASSMESFVNFVGGAHELAGVMNENEIAFLNDKQLKIAPSKGSIVRSVRYHSLEDKVKFLMKRFAVEIEPTTSVDWMYFLELKKYRDGLIHSRDDDDERELAEYRKVIEQGLNATIRLISMVAIKTLNKPLRQRVKDLSIE